MALCGVSGYNGQLQRLPQLLFANSSPRGFAFVHVPGNTLAAVSQRP